MDCDIQIARPHDVDDISRVIISALRETNTKDYSETVIERVGLNFSPKAVAKLLARRLVLVAIVNESIVGTASLDDRVVRSVFVDPDCQGHGVGRALMSEIERAAVERGISVLAVPSSTTAEAFYAKLGFIAVRDSYHGEERTIVMERRLSGAADPL